MFNGYCFDIEANGLYFEATKIWTISLRIWTTQKLN